MNVTYAVEPEPLDTAGAIRFAAHFADFGTGCRRWQNARKS